MKKLYAYSAIDARPNKAYKGWCVFGFIAILLSICIVGATQYENLLAWGVGLLYVSYDTWLLSYVAWKTNKLDKKKQPIHSYDVSSNTIKVDESSSLELGVLVPVYNESDVILDTLEHLLNQSLTPKQIIIVNDGSTDDTQAKLVQHYGFYRKLDSEGQTSSYLPFSPELYASKHFPNLFLLNKRNSGKADSLNQALRHLSCDVVVTVDADTLLEQDAMLETQQAFIREPNLVAACGVLKPVTKGSWGARLFGLFQYFEYLRAFLSRAAWSQSNALLLVSGAFSAYNKQALIKVGGYDEASLVEDYELIHRMHKYSCDQGYDWRVSILEHAHATTDAPTTISAFITQRKRWFAGFLRTQFKYRHMIGESKYNDVGRFMLPIKTIDTLQPIFGLVALFLLWRFITTDTQIASYVLMVIGMKLAIDYCFHMWALRKYHRWLDQGISHRRWWQATLCCLADPFFFQPLRHFSALVGWTMVLKTNVRWEPVRIKTNP